MHWSLHAFTVWDRDGVEFAVKDGTKSVSCRISRDTLVSLPGLPMDDSIDAVRIAFDWNVDRIAQVAFHKAAASGRTGTEPVQISQSDFDRTQASEVSAFGKHQ